MRTLIALFIVFNFTILISCKDESPSPTDRVTIQGKDYSFIKIGTQTWTTSNYAGSGGRDYDDSNTKPEYGKYYTKAELSTITLPEGWRIPTMEDYKALAQHYNIPIPSTLISSELVKNLTSASNWNHVQGTNASGFNAQPGGYMFGEASPIDGDISEFWTAEGYTFSIQEAGAELSSLRITLYDSNNSADYRFNVRFVKE